MSKNQSNIEESKYEQIVKNIRKVFVYLVVFLFCLFIGLFWFLQTGFARNKLKEILIDVAHKKFGIELQIGKLSGGFLYDVSLERIQAIDDGVTILTVDRVSCEYFGHLLFAKRFFVERLQVEGLKLALVKTAQGTWNVNELLRTDKQKKERYRRKSAFEIVLQHVAILGSDITVTVQTPSHDQNWELQDINAVAELRNRPELKAVLHRLSLNLEPTALGRINLSGRVAQNTATNQLRLDDVILNTEASELAVNGTINFDDDTPVLDLTLAVNSLSLQELHNTFSMQKLPDGFVRGSVQLTGTPEYFSHHSELQLDNLGLRTKGTIDLSSSSSPIVDIAGNITHLDPFDIFTK